MKSLAAFFFLFFLACNNRQETPVSDQQQKIDVRDTNILNRPQQKNPFAPVDVSPLDVAYMPPDYPILKMSHKTETPPIARVLYSRPYRQGRAIFGSLLKYGEPWRLGANEATEIEFFQPVTIQGKRIEKSRYILYCIPNEQKWTIIFNNNLFSWGLTPDPANDAFKFEVPVAAAPGTLEYFTMAFEKTATGADLIIAWENVVSRLPIQY